MEDTQIEMYPNPVSNQLTIYGSSDELEHITIYNAIGQDVSQLIQYTENSGTKLMLDMTRLKSGVYFIRTKTTANQVYKQ